MKTFFFTTLFRLFVLAGGWIYLSSFQSELLYNTLKITNPATEATTTCMSGIDSLSGSLHTKLDIILSGIQHQPESNIISPFVINTGTNNTGNIKVIENLRITTGNSDQ